jgi:hypothetical protein
MLARYKKIKRGAFCAILGGICWAWTTSRGIGQLAREEATARKFHPQPCPLHHQIPHTARPSVQFRRWTDPPAPQQPLPTPFSPPPSPPVRFGRRTPQTLAMGLPLGSIPLPPVFSLRRRVRSCTPARPPRSCRHSRQRREKPQPRSV